MAFANYLGINPDDYVVITSFTHQPMYKPFIIELPDNWLHKMAYNVTLDEMMEITDYSIDRGYTISWAADVSETGFSHRNCIAVWPKGGFDGMDRSEISEALKSPQEQEVVTADSRQEGYDNYTTTDDHGMHITGMYREKNGDMYYKVKNSWGEDSNEQDGYLFASEAYLRAKTIDIMVHKDAIPKSIRKKLSL
jgi:bleomycin hydrolase